MRFQVFQFPLPYDGDMSELNQFVSTHRVVTVTQSIVRVETSPLLVFVVEYIDGQPSQVKGGSERIDYLEKFSPEEFAFYSQLRDERKKIADEAGVPIYTVLTNAQLAEIVERKIGTVEELLSINGMGKARIEKFGTRLIELFNRLLASYSHEPGKGLPIGALTSQHLGDFYLDPVDSWAKQTMSVRPCPIFR